MSHTFTTASLENKLKAFTASPEKLVDNPDSQKITIFIFTSGNRVQKQLFINHTEKYSDHTKPAVLAKRAGYPLSLEGSVIKLHVCKTPKLIYIILPESPH